MMTTALPLFSRMIGSVFPFQSKSGCLFRRSFAVVEVNAASGVVELRVWRFGGAMCRVGDSW